MTGESRRVPSGVLFALCLLGLLLLLFHRSLHPDYVHFSNDGPLGALSLKALEAPSAFLGVWYDSNGLGFNGGAQAPGLTQTLVWLLGPLYFAKFFVLLAIFFVGLCAWVFFRQLRLSPSACFLGGLAAALNSDFFSTACWGVGSQTVAFGFDFLALAAVVGSPPRWRWAGYALCGLCVGLNVMEAADIGAIFSLFVAAFVLYHAWVTGASEAESPQSPQLGAVETGKAGADRKSPVQPPAARGAGGGELQPARDVGTGSPAAAALKWLGAGVVRVAVVAGFAAWVAAQSVHTLVGTSIQGVVGAEQTPEARQARWDWATQWSLPKREALGLFIPGLFGFRMDTPEGGNYWGATGRDPAWDRYFASGREGPPPMGFMRYVGGGSYAGVLVVLVAVWAGVQSLRREASVFTLANRRWIWFWWAVIGVSLLLAFGRHAPFYRLLYALPYFSTIRNPAKFLHVLSWALVIVFAYGVHALTRCYLEKAGAPARALGEHLRLWWARASRFDRRWVIGCALALGAGFFGWMIYASARGSLVEYLQTVQFDEETARAIARFSLRAAGWFLVLFALAAGALTLILSGWFAGGRARWGAWTLGILLVGDLARANQPWIVHWNYREKYATNPVIEFLRERPWEHRVAILPLDRLIRLDRLPREAEPLLRAYQQLRELYEIEWKQHHFLYYQIQCLDIIQEPRVAADKAAFEAALLFAPLRRWELTNTRYLLGPAVLLDFLNEQLDPAQKRFRIALQFSIVPKPGVARPTRYEDITAVVSTNGPFAVFEFTGALPRARLFSQWQVCTNEPAALREWVEQRRKLVPAEWGMALASLSATDQATLRQLAEPEFDPQRTVLLTEPPAFPAATNGAAGEVRFESYAPKRIVLKARAEQPALLLLCDKYDPNWRVSVDGQPAPLLRADFILRAVPVSAGEHTVEFRFEPPTTYLWVSLTGLGLGVVLLALMILSPGRAQEPAGGPTRVR